MFLMDNFLLLRTHRQEYGCVLHSECPPSIPTASLRIQRGINVVFNHLTDVSEYNQGSSYVHTTAY